MSVQIGGITLGPVGMPSRTLDELCDISEQGASIDQCVIAACSKEIPLPSNTADPDSLERLANCIQSASRRNRIAHWS